VAEILTELAVRKFKPAAERRIIRDGGARSLYLVVQPTGHKSWMMRFRRPDGRPAKIVLGPLDLSRVELKDDPEIGQGLSLAAARALAAKLLRDRKNRDVISDHKIAKHRRRAEIAERAAGTFGALVRRFIEEHARPKTRRWRDVARLLGLSYSKDGGEPTETKGLARRWADRDVRTLDGHDIYGVVEEARVAAVPGIVARNAGTSEARALAFYAALSSMFSWLQRRRWVDGNPCTSVHRPPPLKTRDRVLIDAEIAKFWAACDTVREPFGRLFKLLLLTGCRLNEVAGMTHAELSNDGTTWSIPGERTKNRRAYVVPLPPLARELIASVAEEGELVFTTNGKTPVSGWSKLKKRLDEAMKIPPWRLHDLRRTFVTGLIELGIPPHIVELAVNHISGTRSGVAGVYNRSEMMPERREALERWARYVALVIDADLHAAHEKFLAKGDDKTRKKSRDAFDTAIAEGGERWDRYLKTIATGSHGNIVALPPKRGKR